MINCLRNSLLQTKLTNYENEFDRSLRLMKNKAPRNAKAERIEIREALSTAATQLFAASVE